MGDLRLEHDNVHRATLTGGTNSNIFFSFSRMFSFPRSQIRLAFSDWLLKTWKSFPWRWMDCRHLTVALLLFLETIESQTITFPPDPCLWTAKAKRSLTIPEKWRKRLENSIVGCVARLIVGSFLRVKINVTPDFSHTGLSDRSIFLKWCRLSKINFRRWEMENLC